MQFRLDLLELGRNVLDLRKRSLALSGQPGEFVLGTRDVLVDLALVVPATLELKTRTRVRVVARCKHLFGLGHASDSIRSRGAMLADASRRGARRIVSNRLQADTVPPPERTASPRPGHQLATFP